MYDGRQNPESQPRSGFVRFIQALVRLAIAAVLLFIIAAAFWFGWQQLSSWMNQTNRRMVLLETDTDFLLENLESGDGRYNELRTRAALAEQESASLSKELSSQADLLATVESQNMELSESGLSTNGAIDDIRNGLIALQEDVNANFSELDSLGGQLDGFSVNVIAIEATLLELDESVEHADTEISRLHQAFYWFHLWELVARARLHLTENDFGQATAGIEEALVILSDPPEAVTVDLEILYAVTSRLELAVGNLPDQADIATADLESAWAVIDQIISALLELESVNLDDIDIQEELTEPDETAAPDLTGTPLATATQTADGTPTPEPVQTPLATESPNSTATPES